MKKFALFLLMILPVMTFASESIQEDTEGKDARHRRHWKSHSSSHHRHVVGATGATGPAGATGATGVGIIPSISVYTTDTGTDYGPGMPLLLNQTNHIDSTFFTILNPAQFQVNQDGIYNISFSASGIMVFPSIPGDSWGIAIGATPGPAISSVFFAGTSRSPIDPDTVNGEIVIPLNAGQAVSLIVSTSSRTDVFEGTSVGLDTGNNVSLPTVSATLNIELLEP